MMEALIVLGVLASIYVFIMLPQSLSLVILCCMIVATTVYGLSWPLVTTTDFFTEFCEQGKGGEIWVTRMIFVKGFYLFGYRQRRACGVLVPTSVASPVGRSP